MTVLREFVGTDKLIGGRILEVNGERRLPIADARLKLETRVKGLIGEIVVTEAVAEPLTEAEPDRRPVDAELDPIPNTLTKLTFWVNPISGEADIVFDATEAPCDETLTVVMGLAVDRIGATDRDAKVTALVVARLEREILATPTGTRATSSFPTPSRLPTPVPTPPTTFPSVSVAPLSVHCRMLLSYVAPAQPGVPMHESRHSARLGRTFTLRFVWRMFVLQRTW